MALARTHSHPASQAIAAARITRPRSRASSGTNARSAIGTRADQIERERKARHVPPDGKGDYERERAKQKKQRTDGEKYPERPSSQFGDSRHRKFREHEIDHHFHAYQTRQCNEVDDERDRTEAPGAPPKRKEQAGDQAERHDLGERRKKLRQIGGRDECAAFGRVDQENERAPHPGDGGKPIERGVGDSHACLDGPDVQRFPGRDLERRE